MIFSVIFWTPLEQPFFQPLPYRSFYRFAGALLLIHTLKIGDKAPDFPLPANGDQEISLSDYKGQKVVLYFYPKDNTPGCTTESCDFRDHKKEFEGLNAQIIGISKCSVKKHDNFVAKQSLNFPLVSDEHGDVCRSTFVIDEQGNIEAIWRKVKVKGHVAEVKATLDEAAAKAA